MPAFKFLTTRFKFLTMRNYDNFRTSIPEGHPKTEKWHSQAQRISEALMRKPMTRLQVASATQTPIQNVCRRVGELRKLGQVCVVKKDLDPLSGVMAEYISIDPRICRPCHQSVQTSLFE